MAEEVQDTIVVCAKKAGAEVEKYFDDNREAPCAGCGEILTHRPHAPEPSIKLCIECATERLKDTPEAPMSVTKESLQELQLLFGGNGKVH